MSGDGDGNRNETKFSSSATNENENEVILVTTGTFNPPHRGHVAMMEQAVAHLRSLGYVVRRALVSPSHQDYVLSKLRHSKDSNRLVFSGDQRAELVATALAASSIADIASVCRIELDAPHFIEHTNVCEIVAQRHGLPVVFVAGSDLAVRRRGWYSTFAVCVIGRTDRSYRTSIEPSREDSTRMALVDLTNRRQVMLEDHKRLRFLVPTTDDVSIATASSTAVNDGDWALLPPAIIPLVERFAGIKIPIPLGDRKSVV